MLKAIEMKKGIYWVGAVDWSMRSFHGYSTRRGSSYNAYLILAHTDFELLKILITCLDDERNDIYLHLDPLQEANLHRSFHSIAILGP